MPNQAISPGTAGLTVTVTVTVYHSIYFSNASFANLSMHDRHDNTSDTGVTVTVTGYLF
jgi:hypothetical protein